MPDSGALTDNETDYGLKKIYTVEPAAGVQRFKWRVSRPWNACVQEDNGNSIRIYRDLWIVRWTFLKPVKLIANADHSHWKTT